MSNKDQIWLCLVTGVVSVTVSLFLAWLLFGGTQQNIKTINLGKIHSAELMMTMKASKMGDQGKAWIQNVDNASKNLKNVIQQYAGNSIVIVSPAVVTGSEDITKPVLKALGLPENVPDLQVPKDLVLGGMRMKTAKSQNDKVTNALNFLKP